MRYVKFFSVTALFVVATLGGCARSVPDTEGFALTDTAEIQLSASEAWQVTKQALLDLDLDLYTRDRRGRFVAFSSKKRGWFNLGRVKYTIDLTEQAENRTKITVETLRQVYGSTLLTEPGWHDRKTTENSGAQQILDSIQRQSNMGSE